MPDVSLRSIEPLIAIILDGTCGSGVPPPPDAIAALIGRFLPRLGPVCTENLIRVADVMESPKLAE